MKAQVGQFVIAKTYYVQDSHLPQHQQRSKARPVLILAAMLGPDNVNVYLCAQLSTQTDKIHGDSEVLLTARHTGPLGIVKEGEDAKPGVCRFNQRDLVAIRETQISHYLKSYKTLPSRVQLALCNAAKTVNCLL